MPASAGVLADFALLGLELAVELLEFGVGLLIFLFQAGQFGLQFRQMLLVGVECPLQPSDPLRRRTSAARSRFRESNPTTSRM